METPFCKRFAKNHWIAGFIETKQHDGPEHYGTMKAKRGRYRLSPNEEAQLVKDETERRRKQRIVQVREQSKQNANKIRQAVRQEKDRQVQKLALELQNQLEKEKEEKVRKLEAQYENSLKTIGQGHKEAGEQYDRTEERELLQQEDNRRADARGSAAMDKLRREKIFREFEETKIIKTRQAALEEEKKRAALVAALPPPEPDPALNIHVPTKKPVRMTDVDNFTTTHYHILEQYSIDKADPNKQGDARAAAEDEEIRIRERSQELVRLSNDRMAKARVRHNNALEKEILSHDYDQMLHDLSDLQRADRDRRLHVVANIPKQVFEPPHGRMEDREDHQRNLESAFEDMYMAQTNYIGDLSLALDPHPPSEAPSATESLDVTTATEGTPVQEPTLPRVPPVLKDMTNIPRAPGEKSPAKKPGKVLKKLMEKIKSQRDDWISKSNGDINLPEDTTSKMPEHDDSEEVPTRLSAPESTGDKSVDSVLEQQKEIDPILKLMAYGTNIVNQKRVLEEKLRALEAEHEASKRFVESQSIQPHLMNGYAPTAEHPVPSSVHAQPSNQPYFMNGYTSTTVPSSLQQLHSSSVPMATRPALASSGTQQFYQQQLPTQQSNVRVPDQPYPLPVTLLPREPVVSSLPKQYIPLSYKQQTDQPFHPPADVTSQIRPPTYSTALSQSKSQQEAGNRQFIPQQQFVPPSVQQQQYMPPYVQQQYMPPSVQQQQYFPPSGHQQHYVPPTVPPVSSLAYSSVQHQMSVPSHSIQATHPSLSMSSLSGSSGEYYPQTFPTSSLPIPSTVGLIPVTSYSAQNDHAKKIKEYQQYLLNRHEQSKKVLADTRAEIERRRQELLQRFPQLSSNSPSDSPITKDEKIPDFPTSQRDEEQKTQVSPSKAAISSLVSKLASDPYYASSLGIDGALESKKPEGSKEVKKFKDVRKSLPFDESLQESPMPYIHDSGGKMKFDSTLETDDGRHDLDDTVMSSSTDRGSPKLPGRRSGNGTESDIDTSSQSNGRDTTDIPDKRQRELQHQLEEIQRQKEAILQRHDMAHLRIHAEQERLKYQRQEKEKRNRITEEITSEESTTEVETDDDRQGDILTTKHLKAPPQRQRMNLLSEHRPHELSTIQEVDTPRSAPRSLESGRPSLSSSGSSISKRSLDPYQLSTGTIPEENETAESFATPTNLRTGAETGYHTQQIEEIMQKAREFDPSVVDRFKQQTNDIFAAVATPPQKGGTPGSNMSLSMGSLTPDSLSTGPISDSNASTQFNSPTDAPAFKVVGQKGKDTSRSDSSYPIGMSWADELSNYSGQQQSLRTEDRSSRSGAGAKYVDSSQDKSEDEHRPSKSPVDRKYDVFHMNVDQPKYEKPGNFIDRSISDKSISSEASSRLNIQELSSVNLPEKQGSANLSQYPFSDKSADQSSSGDQSKGYTSSSVVNDSSTRESPVGGLDNEDESKLIRTGESLGSTATSASSYMDLDNGVNKPFDFIGQFRYAGKEQSVSNSSDMLELDSSKYSQKGGMTSTPYTTQGAPELSQYSITPGDFQRASLPQQSMDSYSTPAFIVKSSDLESDHSEPGTGEKKVGATLSQYSLKSDTQGLTIIGKELSQYTMDSDKASPLSQYSLETTENVSPDKTPKSLTQYSVDPSMSGKTNELSQHSLDPSRQISGISASDKSLSQYSFGSANTSGNDRVEGQLSQYSIPEKSLTQVNMDESDLGDLSKVSSAPGEGLSLHTVDTTYDDNDAIVEKKFANLDNLIKESRDLIAKHKQLITKNKDFDGKSQAASQQPSSNNNNNTNMAELMVSVKQPEISTKPLLDTSESSFNVTDDVSPMMITASSADMTQDYLRTLDSLETSQGPKIGDTAASRLSQLETTAGISDEPDLTLVTESDISMNQEGQLTQRSEESNNNDSIWSFEQHEQSARSSPDISDIPDLPLDQEEDRSGLARQTLQESFERRQQTMSSVKRDAGEDLVFRAVPVQVSPTLSFSMKLNDAELKPKAPLTWASQLSSEPKQSEKTTGKTGYKSAVSKQEPKKELIGQKSSTTKTVVQQNLNPALKPRSAGSIPSPSGQAQRPSTLGQSKSAGIISLGEFLKNQLSNEDSATAQSQASFSAAKNNAIVTTKNKPAPSINAKPASPSKANPSFYGKAKDPGAAKNPSFSIGKKTGSGTSFSGKPGIYSNTKPQGSKPASSSHMSKTLSSWKKSRAVKSSVPPPPPKQSNNFPTGVKDLPTGVKDFPKSSTRSEEDEAYARHMRAYNPRLFRLQNRLGIEEQEEPSSDEKKKSPKTRETLEEKQKRAAANRDKVKEFQKE